MTEKYVAILGLIGTLLAFMFGEWSAGLTCLCCMMVIDYVTGILVAMLFKKSRKTKSGRLSSSVGLIGLIKKCVMLCLVAVGHRIDIAVGLDVIQTGFIFGFAANELVSIVENCGLMGIPLPKVVINAIDILKNKEGETDAD